MVKVTVVAVTERGDGKKGTALTLLDEAGKRVLNIWIGEREAEVIALGIAETPPIRPLGMHLMVNLLKVTGVELEEVRIETLKDDIFYAVAKFRNGDVSHELDARPSDAIALAMLMDKPIHIADEILERAGVILPGSKTVQMGKAREAVLKKVEELSSKQTSFIKEECEEANRKLVAFLTGE